MSSRPPWPALAQPNHRFGGARHPTVDPAAEPGKLGSLLHRKRAVCLVLVLAHLVGGSVMPLLVAGDPPQASQAAARPATLRVSGLGLLGNRVARRTCLRLLDQPKSVTRFASWFLEDASQVLLNELEQEGFLDVEISVTWRADDGTHLHARCNRQEVLRLPPGTDTDWVEFHVHRGRRYHFADLRFEGVEGKAAREAENFFYPTGGLLTVARERPYSPGGYARSLRNLQRHWWNRGHRQAVVTGRDLSINEATGAVRATVLVEPGPLFRVETLTIEVRDESDAPVRPSPPSPVQAALTPRWEDETRHELQREQFEAGYADATVQLDIGPGHGQAGERLVPVTATVRRGSRVTLGEVSFTGQKRTREGLIRSKTRIAGPWYNPVAVDRARDRLSRLGTFKSVQVETLNPTKDVRDVRFVLEEGRQREVRAIAGYGSYDLLFGGLEFNEYNLFGLGHSARLYGVQSFKSTVGRVRYSVPEFLAPDVTAFASGDLLLREELTFDRRELSGGGGLAKAFPRAGQQLGLRYSYEFLRADSEVDEGPTETRVGAMILEWSIERRRSPLRPERGYHAFSIVEVADETLGGEAQYQRLELGGSYHLVLRPGWFLHLGAWHGILSDFTGDDDALPFNKRFFIGGANSIRGYQYGEASPMDDDGNQLGAVSAIVGNVEFERALTRAWSLVTFLDVGGNALTIDDYPAREFLVSVGGGIRWNTPVGPLRLEYGYNLNRRSGDPDGTLHFSVGFPF